jgi:hypothetical protein
LVLSHRAARHATQFAPLILPNLCCVGCPTGHKGALLNGAAVCLDCTRKVRHALTSSTETAEERKRKAESNLSFVVEQGLFIDLDWIHYCLVLHKSDSRLTSSETGKPVSTRSVPNITTVSQWMAAYRLFLTVFGMLFGGHIRFADRMKYMTWIETLLKSYTCASVLEYDRNFRVFKEGMVEWCDGQISPWHAHLLVPITTRNTPRVPRTAARDSSPNKRQKRASLTDAEKLANGKCNKTSSGGACTHGKNCKYSHKCPKCGKTHAHVWESC